MSESNSSSDRRHELISVISGTVMRWQDATQKFDETVGELFELNGAERLCLSLLSSAGPQTATAIARHTRLTPAAITAMVDRLERRGYVRRAADPTDRRKVLVEPSEETRRLATEIYGPLVEAGAAMLSRYSESELAAVARFATDGLAVQEWMTEDLMAKRHKP
jgi:DNA-binding MarR family transcriptional regulator